MFSCRNFMTARFSSATLSRYSEVSKLELEVVLAGLLLLLATDVLGSLLSFLASDMLPKIE